MASKRDLVEAHAFNRRRLVTAFLSGAPGGREAEPARPARAAVAGLVLAALLLAGAAVTGYLRPGLPSGWDQNTLVVARSSGARYVATGGVLYPVANTTSARLLVPQRDFRVVQAPDDKIATRPRGSSVGIVGAPDALPERQALVQSGWTSCVDRQGGTRLRLAGQPGAAPALPGSALLVTSGSELYAVIGTARHRVPARDRDATLRALGLDAAEPVRAPGAWVDQFPLAEDLAPLRVPGAGRPVAGGPRSAATTGQALVVTQPDGSERTYLRTGQGLAPLSELATALHEVGTGLTAGAAVRVTQADVRDLPTGEPLHPASWPQQLPTPLDAPVACALLTTQPQDLPVVTLAVPTDEAAQPVQRSDAVVEPARGALVRAVAGGIVNRGQVFLVDPTGTAFALGDPEPEVQAQLGYAGVLPAAVPLAFLSALRDGPELSAEAARQQVAPGPGTP